MILQRLFVVLLVVLSSSVSYAQTPIVTEDYDKLVWGLSESEAGHFKQVVEDTPILDLEGSSMLELSRWLDKTSDRLSTAIEKEGEQFAVYRTFFVASEDAHLDNYKHRPNAQNYYRGYVYVTTGMVKKLLSSLNADPATITEAQAREFLDGLAGLIADQYAEPKQDEMSRFRLRSMQDLNWGRLQADQVATDLLALKILRSAGFDQSALLTGLELSYGPRAFTKRDFFRRTLGALFSIKPEQKLRLNLVRAALAHDRLNLGEISPEPMAFDLEALRSDLSRLLAGHEAYLKTRNLNDGMAVESEPTFTEHLRSLKMWLDKTSDGDSKTSSEYRGRLLALKSVLDKRGTGLTKAEFAEFTNLIDFIFVDKVFMLSENQVSWKGDDFGKVLKKRLTNTDMNEVRRRQKLLNDHPAFNSPFFEAWLEQRLKNVWQVVPFGDEGEFEFLPSVFPEKITSRIYDAVLSRLSEQNPLPRARILLGLLYGNISMGGDIERDFRILSELKALIAAEPVAFEAVAQVWTEISGTERKYANERLIRWEKAHPNDQRLLEVQASILRMLLEHPESAGAQSFQKSTLSYDSARIMEVLAWQLDLSQKFLRFKRHTALKTAGLVKELTRIFSNPSWKAHIDAVFAGKEAISKSSEARTPLDAAIKMLNDDGTPFRVGDKLILFRSLMPAWSNGESYIKARLAAIQALKNGFQSRAAIDFYEDALKAGHADPFKLITDIAGENADIQFELFASNGDRFIEFVTKLGKRGLLSEQRAFELLDRFLTGSTDGELAPGLFNVNQASARRLWSLYRKQGISGVEFLKRFLPGFEAARYGKIDLKIENYLLKNAIRDAQRVNVPILPQYARVITHLSDQLLDDVRRDLGLKKGVKAGSPEFVAAFKTNFPLMLEYYRLIFNPDGKLIPTHLRGLVSYDALDDLSKSFVGMIPENLDLDMYEKLWTELSTKRANQYTDELFEKHLLKGKTPEQLLETLRYNRVFSERLKIEALRVALEPEIKALEKSSPPSDKGLYEVTNKIQGFASKSSRFKDTFLEDLAWRLNLGEAQLVKFVEPMKSFNYAAMDIRTVNLMSATSVLLEKLSNADKLRLVDYIREPHGELLAAVPSIQKAFDDLNAKVHWLNEQNNVQEMEAFVRDASENERHLMLELVVGTKEVGLWFQGDKIREELFERAKLEPNSRNRVLFDSYLMALPEYEHSIILSYLLALDRGSDKGGFDLVSVLEMHRTPGVKFAQMASILGIFGEETREQLAKTKDRAMKPSKYEIYKMLKEVYPTALYDSIKSVKRMLGSGSLKVVALVEFKDGTMEAVSIKRPHADDTIRSTLDLAERWMTHLRKNPEYTDAYDYEYYLSQLRKQLSNEVKFETEVIASREMIGLYKDAKPVRGWSFGKVPPSEKRLQTNDVLHFMPITDSTKYDKMSDEDKRAAAELILEHELKLLFKVGIFDADRTLGNYLFNPKEKKVYPLDMGQVYHLERRGFLTPDDRFYLAQLIMALSDADHAKAARRIMRVFLILNESDKALEREQQQKLQDKIQEALSAQNVRFDQRLLRVLTEANLAGIHIPLRYSMGVVKGLTILSNENYSRFLPEGFIEARIREFARWQVARAKVIELLGRNKCEAYLLK